MRGIVDFAERTVQMDKTKGFDFERLTTSGEVDCACGQKHSTDMKILAAGRGIIEEVPAALEKLNVRRPMVVSGPFSFEAVGKKVCGILENAKIAHSVFAFEKTGTKKLQPNEEAVAKIIEHFDPRCDVLLCVGSGSVGDVCKAAATELKVPQLTVGSAPSMDGYTSASASLELHNTKTSVSVNAPVGVICDVELMAQAPMRLLWAGLGDMAAKPCSLCEWEMASVILGEHYCPYTVDLVKQSYERSFSGAPGIPERSLDSVQAVIEGLLLSGVCMSYVHSSRPASGLEHYFSHCWEMMAIARGKEYDLHGIYVGIGAVLTLHIFRKLRQLHPDRENAEMAAAAFDRAAWEARLRRVFHGTAENFIALEEKVRKNDRENRMQRVDRILENWDQLVRILEKAPEPEELEGILRSAGMPTKAGEIGLSADDAADAFVCSRDTRDKYLTSSLIWDIGYMDEFEAFVRELV